MQNKELVKRVYNLAKPKTDELGINIWDIDFEKEGVLYMLTIYLDAEREISITDCEQVSRFIDPLLDEPEFSSLPSYTLCVSSAGLERKLTKQEHFEYAIDKYVNVGFYKNINGTKSVEGVLKYFDKDKIIIITDDKENEILRNDISKIRLAIKF